MKPLRAAPRLDPTMVPRIPIASLTPEEFRERFMAPNLPVMLTGAADSWRATAEWVAAAGQPAVSTLAALFPDSEVSVVDGKGTRREMSISEYATWWERRGEGEPPLYLKDWHLPHLHAEYGAYALPAHVADDWLNEHWSATSGGDGGDSGGDHRFVYVGPAGSRTALHADVFFSFSWSANVCGSKRWWLLPAADRRLVSDAATQPLARDILTLPAAASRAIEVEQGAGEMLFVPSGWYHQVENTADTISVNHNWLNACNAKWALLRLREVLAAVRLGLGEEADDQELCMGLLRARCGLDLYEWAKLLAGVARRRLPRLAPPRRTTRAIEATAATAAGGLPASAASAAASAASATPARAREDVEVAAALLGETIELLSAEAASWDELEEERHAQLLTLRRELDEAERVLRAVEGGRKRRRPAPALGAEVAPSVP